MIQKPYQHSTKPSAKAFKEVPQSTRNGLLPDWDASKIRPDAVDFGSDDGIAALHNQFETERRTLARLQRRLLKTSTDQFVVIQGGNWGVKPTLEEAVQWGRSTFPDGLFFLGRISEIDFKQYLAVP